MRSLGRPNTKAQIRSIRLGDDIEAQLAAWIAKQPEPRPTQSQAIRCLLEHALVDGGPTGPQTVEQKIAIVEEVIENTPIPKERTPARGLALLKRGKAEAGLAGLKARYRNGRP